MGSGGSLVVGEGRWREGVCVCLYVCVMHLSQQKFALLAERQVKYGSSPRVSDRKRMREKEGWGGDWRRGIERRGV